MKILIIEDEPDLLALLAKGLKKSGYVVDLALDGEEGLNLYEINSYDLIVLDLNLPKIDGIKVLQAIRQKDLSIRILILSARSSIAQRVEGLDQGANDYLIKPFDFYELEARIRALLRISVTQRPTILFCGKLKLEILKKQVGIEEKQISLTKKEYAILEYLFFHQGEVISSEELIEHVWDSEVDLFSNSLKFHIYSIKKKMEQLDQENSYIQTIRGQGYCLEIEPVNCS